jgi:hypothetical protein
MNTRGRESGGVKSLSGKESGSIFDGFSRSELKIIWMGLNALVIDILWANEKEKGVLKKFANKIKTWL